MIKFQPFSTLERALTLGGLGPALLLGCAVNTDSDSRARLYLPEPNYDFMAMGKAKQAESKQVPAAPRALTTTLNVLTKSFDGVVGVAVTSIDEGWTAESNGDRKLPQQSVSKLWVAMTLLDKVDQGKISLDQELTITKSDFTLFHQPVASLVKDDEGYRATVREILRRALTMSDNTCNDKLLRLVGGPQVVRDFIAKNGLGAIRFGPGERDLQSATAGLTWKPEYSMGRSFQAARAKLDPAVRLAAFESYVSDPPDGAAPASIAGALAKLKRGELLSATSTQWLITTMEKSHTGKQRLRGAVPRGWEFGHKTGTGQDLRGRTAGYNDVGILTAPDGKAYALAVMIGDTPRSIPERQELMHTVVAAIVSNHH